MPVRNKDLHGSAPDKCDTALLIVDVINDFDFSEANQLMRYAPAIARKLAKLKLRTTRGHSGDQRDRRRKLNFSALGRNREA